MGTLQVCCATCGHRFEAPWAEIFDLQEMTTGYAGYEYEPEIIICPQCGANAMDGNGEGEEIMDRDLPKSIRADQCRAVMHAYYRDVCRCHNVPLDIGFGSQEWVAVGKGDQTVWFADFSTYYEFPEEMKPATVTRRLQERAAQAVHDGPFYGDPSGERPRRPVAVSYEIWCFITPTERLLKACEEARAAGASFTLVTPDQLDARIRQTVLAAQPHDDEHAFVDAAVWIRRAFGLHTEG